MNEKKFETILTVGETVAVEFKQCSGSISADTYKTVCSFLNRYGGDIYLGIENNGTVAGVSQKAVPDVIKNFIKMVGNPEIISPTVYLAPEILEYDGRQVIRIHVPPSSEVHSYKKTIYDRVDDADVKVTATGQIAAMYIRKQNVFTEKNIYPYVREEHLRLDNLQRIRQMAVNRYKSHPWKNLTDAELLQSAGLFGTDMSTGEKGYNLAAVMLFGRDEVIRSIVPAYRTDAILRKINLNRYDDRLIVETNLVDSYELLMGFAQKHLWDKFFLDGDARVSLRDAIAREMLVNTLIHREFTSSYIARFVIEKNRMFVENANRATKNGPITPNDFEPNPKNPLISSFFRNIGLADELGSGVRNLYRYGLRYSGKDPELIDGDVFRIAVPLNDAYSFDEASSNMKIKRNIKRNIKRTDRALIEKTVLVYLGEHPEATQVDVAKAVGKSRRAVQDTIATLKDRKLLEREGARKNGRWIVKQ